MDQNAIFSQFSMQSSRALMFTTNQICHGPCAITLYFFVNKLKIFTCFIHRGLSADRHQPVKSVYCYAQLKTFEISSFSLMRRKETLNCLWFCLLLIQQSFGFAFLTKIMWNEISRQITVREWVWFCQWERNSRKLDSNAIYFCL